MQEIHLSKDVLNMSVDSVMDVENMNGDYLLAFHKPLHILTCQLQFKGVDDFSKGHMRTTFFSIFKTCRKISYSLYIVNMP